ncbi:hypothetical protein C1N58_02415 [Pantoea sp. SGAir0180]|uniref:hypothetical protein n=1 Tax=Pantoea ananas TaxID=553 RepID=UPI000B5E7ED1|nr:hypothetical protein [Pantoea ananatis]ASN14905.1 hypothetical protein B7764_06790 [Pantoea ananatis]RQN03388.1 hypothetical protein EHQ51_00320 [Pantoea ananatis]
MQNIQSATLTKTLKYISKNGIQFKYEIYQSSDGMCLFAMVYRLFELIEGSETWVWAMLDEEVVLRTDGQHPDFAAQDSRKHFQDNYASE